MSNHPILGVLGGLGQGIALDQWHMANQQNQLNQLAAQQMGGQYPSYIPTWNENVPVWSEGGYELWLGKPFMSVDFCQRCLFL